MNKLISIIMTLVLGVVTLVTVPAYAEEKVVRIGFPGATTSRPQSGLGWGYVQAKHLFDEEFKKDGWTIDYNYIAAAGPGVNEGLAFEIECGHGWFQ